MSSKIRKWIKEARKKGFKESQIENSLKKQNYSQKEIDKYMTNPGWSKAALILGTSFSILLVIFIVIQLTILSSLHENYKNGINKVQKIEPVKIHFNFSDEEFLNANIILEAKELENETNQLINKQSNEKVPTKPLAQVKFYLKGEYVEKLKELVIDMAIMGTNIKSIKNIQKYTEKEYSEIRKINNNETLNIRIEERKNRINYLKSEIENHPPINIGVEFPNYLRKTEAITELGIELAKIRQQKQASSIIKEQEEKIKQDKTPIEINLRLRYMEEILINEITTSCQYNQTCLLEAAKITKSNETCEKIYNENKKVCYEIING